MFVMALNSSSAASARVAIPVAIALQPVNTSEASKCQLRERSAVGYFDISGQGFVFEVVKCLCIGAPSKDFAQRFADWGLGIFEKQEKQENKRVPKSKTTTSGSQLGGEEINLRDQSSTPST